VKPVVLWTFLGNVAELPAAVAVEDPGSKGVFDRDPLVLMQLLRRGDDGSQAVQADALVGTVSGKAFEGGWVTYEEMGPESLEHGEIATHVLFGHFITRQKKLWMKPSFQGVGWTGSMGFIETGSPQLCPAIGWFDSTPFEEAIGRSGTKVLAVGIQEEAETFAGTSARRVRNEAGSIDVHSAHIEVFSPDDVLGEERPLFQCAEDLGGFGALADRKTEIMEVRHVLGGMIHDASEKRGLEYELLFCWQVLKTIVFGHRAKETIAAVESMEGMEGGCSQE